MHNIFYLGLSGEHRCPLGYLFYKFHMNWPIMSDPLFMQMPNNVYALGLIF